MNCSMSGASGPWPTNWATLLDMARLLGVERCAAQHFHIGLGIDERRRRRGVAQHGGDNVKRRLLMQQPRRQRMAQRMQPLMLLASELNPGEFSPILDHVVEMSLLGERFKGRR